MRLSVTDGRLSVTVMPFSVTDGRLSVTVERPTVTDGRPTAIHTPIGALYFPTEIGRLQTIDMARCR